MQNESMRVVADDLVNFKFSDEMKIGDILPEFYRIMRKHGIKAGTKSEDSLATTYNNYEWTMCVELLKARLLDYLEMATLFDSVPKDLTHY